MKVRHFFLIEHKTKLGCESLAYLAKNTLMSRDMRFPTMWYVRPAKAQISLRIRSLIRAFSSRLNIL